MRLFEALTIAFAGQVVLAAAIMGTSRPRWMNLLPLAGLAPLAAHLLLEGPRWQMVPAYLVALTAAVLGVVGWGRGPDAAPAPQTAERRRLLSRLAALAGILLLAGSVALSIMMPGR